MQCPEQREECSQTYRSTVSQGESVPYFPERRHTNTRVETRKRGCRMKCEGNVLWKRALRPRFQNQIPPLLIREFQTRTWHQQSIKCSSDLWMILVQKLQQVCRGSRLCFSHSVSADSEAVAVLTVWRENIKWLYFTSTCNFFQQNLLNFQKLKAQIQQELLSSSVVRIFHISVAKADRSPYYTLTLRWVLELAFAHFYQCRSARNVIKNRVINLMLVAQSQNKTALISAESEKWETIGTAIPASKLQGPQTPLMAHPKGEKKNPKTTHPV